MHRNYLLRFAAVIFAAAGLAVADSPSRSSVAESSAKAGEAGSGKRLFSFNCAHCHGVDARGDEGPDLHNLHKSDERIAAIIRNGIKGEMPAFGKKLKDEDVQALIGFIRTLKD